MSFTSEQLQEFLERRANETWDRTSAPYLLALVQPELKASGVDYSEAIPGTRLSEFAGSLRNVKLVRHPTQFAKIGVIPADKEFSFVKDLEHVPSGSLPRKSQSEADSALLDFVRSLTKLEEEDLKSFHVPAILLVALLRAR